jgi:CheY-like chemotaxis protein
MAHVLVVDDDPDIRELLEIRLARLGHDVVGVGSGEAALARMAAGAPDVVVLDVVLMGMSGLDVLAAMRADGTLREVPVVILTGLVRDDATRHDPALHVTYLAKPVLPSVLARVVDDALLTTALAPLAVVGR